MKRWMKWALAALVLAALLAGLIRTLNARKAQQEALVIATAQRSQAPLVLGQADLVRVQSRLLPLEVPVSGTLKAANSAMVKARIAGELQGLDLREGDAVKAGQIVARIDATETQARARQAQQQAQAARAQVDIAQRAWENSRSLFAQNFISATALQAAEASYQAAQATYNAALAGAEVADKVLQDTVLRAPLAGLVSQRLAQNGERLALDGRVLEILDMRSIELEASLSPADAATVRAGQMAVLTVEGVARPVQAEVVRINPAVQPGGRAVLVYLRLGNAEGLRQGMFAQGMLTTGQAQSLVLPLTTVRTDKPLPYVQWIQGGKVAHAPVQTGVRATVEGQTLVAVTGVPENTPVLAGALGALPAGTAVSATQAP